MPNVVQANKILQKYSAQMNEDYTITVGGFLINLENSTITDQSGVVYRLDGTATKDGKTTSFIDSAHSNYDSVSDTKEGSVEDINNMSDVQLNYKTLLCSEDAHPVSLSLDKTAFLMSRGVFRTHVLEFVNTFGSLSGSKKKLTYTFVRKLIDSGDFGLLTLLIAVANYGIADPPSSWSTDAIKLDPEYGRCGSFCASNYGKSPFDYKSGGLGIAHWDTSHLIYFYQTFGFKKDLSDAVKSKFAKLLVTDKSLSGWKEITYKGETRIAPTFSVKHPKGLNFDDGLKIDPDWLAWARGVLYDKDSSGNYIYLVHTFEHWIDKFWIPTVNGLNSAQAKGKHCCLQDAVRISRAGNSASGLISMSCGKSVSEQYENYYGDKERYMRQKGFCRRCADIIGYEC